MLVRPAESECEYVELRAKNDAAGAPYRVPSGDVVQCFLIDAGFDAPTQALEFKALVEHPELVVHMVVRSWGRSDVRGPLISCSEGNETYAMVAVWALVSGRLFLTILMALLAFENWRMRPR